jgi:hypothetical protein
MPAVSDQNQNAYCERLGIAVPRPEELLGQRELKLFELIVVVLLEHGRGTRRSTLATQFESTLVQIDLRKSRIREGKSV